MLKKKATMLFFFLMTFLKELEHLLPRRIICITNLKIWAIIQITSPLFSSWLTDADPGSPDPTRTEMQVCPFCQRSYQWGPYLREHMKLCQEREGGHNVCPLCGYSTPYRAQMERHMALHTQVKEKVGAHAAIHSFNSLQHVVM